jgi:hypothetical protein
MAKNSIRQSNSYRFRGPTIFRTGERVPVFDSTSACDRNEEKSYLFVPENNVSVTMGDPTLTKLGSIP